MASKVKMSRLESEIEKCRVEGEWNKVSELVKQLSSKNPGLGKDNHVNGWILSVVVLGI